MRDTFAVVHAASERQQKQIRDAAAIMGVNEAYISRLVAEFHARLRNDARLGPIIEAAFGDDWALHLERMTKFWVSLALGDGGYRGQPHLVFRKLSGLRHDDFSRWLGILRETLDQTAPSSEAKNYLLLRAERVKRSLEMAVFDRGADGVPSLH